MVALSSPASAGGDNDHPYLQCLRRSNWFVQAQSKEAFIKLKEYLANPPVLCKLQPSTPLRLYFCGSQPGDHYSPSSGTGPVSETHMFHE